MLRAGAGARREPGGARGVELGGLVARRRARRCSAPASARTACTGSGETTAGRRAHGDLARRSTSSTSTARCAVASGLAAAGAHGLLEPLEPGPDHGWLAFHEGFVAHAGGDTGDRPRARRARAAGLGRRFGVADLEMLGLALEGSALVRLRAGRGGHALPRRGDGDRPRGRGDDPDLGRVGLLLPGLRVHGGARLRAGARSGATGSPSSRERYGSRYMLAFCRAEYGAVELWRGRWADGRGVAGGLDRGLLALAPGDGSAARMPRPRRAAATAGPRSRRRSGCSTAPAPRRGAALPRAPARSTAGDARRRGRAGRARAAPGAGGPARSTARRRSSCSSGPGRRGAASPMLARRRAGRAPRRSSGVVGHRRRCGRCARPRPEACSRAAGGDHERARAAARGRGRRLRAQPARRSRPPSARIELATSLVALGRSEAAAREAARWRCDGLLDARRCRGGGAGRAPRSPPSAAGGLRAGRSSRAREREVLVPARRGAHEPPDRRAPRRSASTPSTGTWRTSCASSSLPSRTAAAARAVRRVCSSRATS